MRHQIRCFVDSDGHIWSINEKGESNFPGKIEVGATTVKILGAEDAPGSHLIKEEYPLWASLTDLAMALEQEIPESEDGSINLDQAVAEAHQQAESFRRYWLKGNERSPECFPMVLPASNAGIWFEQIAGHEPEEEDNG